MKVKIKKLHKDATIPFKTFDSDFCYDVVATSCEEIAPNVYRYGTGLAFQIERNDNNLVTVKNMYQLSLDFRPRSSVWKTGMVLSNCVGTIDESYTGEVCAVFYHVMPSMPKYEVGDKIGQIKMGYTWGMDFVEVSELDETERGANGYGSTGK